MAAVKEDAKETTELDTGSPATAEEDHPPQFVSAAKREHQNEAAALRHHRIEFGTQVSFSVTCLPGKTGLRSQPLLNASHPSYV